MISTAYSTGLMLSFSLILAIGAQNAFVLRQGLRNEYLLPVVLTCAFSDAILILFGVSSFSQIITHLPWLDPVMRYGGAVFLIWYGCKSMYSSVRKTGNLVASNDSSKTLPKTVLTCLALTWLNPHVYLDTVVLIGTISTRFPGKESIFALGATTASFIFFFALGYGATLLRPLFARPVSWRILEGLIALVMWMIAIKLIFK
jgi:L-lysine exporter family protein LysE/ArgO